MQQQFSLNFKSLDMQKYFRLVVTSILVVFIIFGCKDDSDTPPKGMKNSAVAKFELPFNNTSFQRGKPITVDVKVNDLEGIKTLKIFIKDSILFDGKPEQENYSFNVKTNNWSLGSNQISLEARTKDNKLKRDNRLIKVLSDVYPKEYTAEVISIYPHQTSSYTQGLEFNNGQLYEGTGGQGNTGTSIIAKVNYTTGQIQQKKTLDQRYFGEGITVMGNQLFQLTWQQNTCFVYDKNDLTELKKFSYNGEGWGLCNDGEFLIMSDGSERLSFRDPKNFGLKKVVEVYSNEGPVMALNELEYINGKIFANVYQSNYIVVINPETGAVEKKIDASLVALDHRKTGDVLNGIAYLPETKQLFITGKNWPSLLEIGLVE
jgi:glutamine cyclotransferase